jgi:hypothetical protein
MRRTICVASLAIVLCALLTLTASAETTITRVSTSAQPWYIKSDSPVTVFSELTWEPGVSGRKKQDRFELAPAAAASGAQTIQRETCWRLDEGQVEDIDWDKVQHQLWAKFAIRIGETSDISVPEMAPVECYRVCGYVYASYSREVYEINQKGKTAVISILRPIDGQAVIFDTCCVLGYSVCDGCASPVSTPGICASATADPFDSVCTTDRSGRKRNFREDPSLTPDDPALSTWGKIKALYHDD